MVSTANIQGSLGWQIIFVFISAGWLLLSVMRGWVNGLICQLLTIVAAIGAGFLVLWFAGSFTEFLHSTTNLSGLPRTLLTVALVWGIAYNAITLIGRILFKRTRDQGSGVVRLIYGFGGALVGLTYGLVFIWAVIIGIRVVGRVAESQVEIQKFRSDTLPVWVVNAAKLKNSVELGVGYAVITAIDPLPNNFYREIDLYSRLTATPQAIQKVMEYPGFKRLWQNPKIASLGHDPEIVAAVQERNILVLISHPKIIALLNDPELHAAFSREQLDAALEYSDQ